MLTANREPRFDCEHDEVPVAGPHVPERSDSFDPELVVREARRRQRRRWLLVASALLVATGGTAAGAAAFAGSGKPHGTALHTPRGGAGHAAIATASPAMGSWPESPASLALAPNGTLYIADDTKNEIFERLPRGTFKVAVGNGKKGFSGDYGSARNADIDRPGAMAVASDGTLYFADSGNGRVRKVSPSGTITTVAGSGVQGGWIADGTPALDAPLQTSSITLSPSGQLYIATGAQVLALEPNGTLTSVLGSHGPHGGIYGVGGPAVDASADGAYGLAFNAAGDLFVFGEATKSILMVTPDGILRLVPGNFYPRGPGGLVSTPDGAVLAISDTSIVRLTPQGEQTVIAFPAGPSPPDTYLGVKNVAPVGIAVARDGTIYLDTNPDDGYSNAAVIAATTPGGAGTLLWRR